MAVSRCMNARCRGSSTAITVSTEPTVNRLRARVSMPLWGGALTHPDHDRPVADHGDVAALDRGRLVGEGVVAVEHVELGVPEHRVEVVDDPGVDGLALAGGLGHRVDRDSVVDPRGVVALEQVVRQGRQQEVVWTQVVHQQARLAQPTIEIGLEDTADQQVSEEPGRGRGDKLIERLVQRRPESGGCGEPVLDELPGPGLVQRLGEELGEVVDLAPPGTRAGRRRRRAPGARGGPTSRRRTTARRRSRG